MFWADGDFIYVNALNKPASLAIAVRSEEQVITAHHTLAHFPRFSIKSPILQSIAPLPTHSVSRVLVFIPELHGDAIITERKELLAQTVVVLSLPLSSQKRDNILGAG